MVHVKSWNPAALFLADSGIINAKVVEGFAIASIMLDMVMKFRIHSAIANYLKMIYPRRKMTPIMKIRA